MKAFCDIKYVRVGGEPLDCDKSLYLKHITQKIEQHERTISQLVEIVAVLNRQLATYKEGVMERKR